MANTNQSMINYILSNNINPNQAKLVFYNRVIHGKRFFSDIQRIAKYLRAVDVKKGDSIIICMPNMPEAVVALYAINTVGAVSNIVHPKIGTDALVRIIKESNTKIIFMFDKFIKNHEKALRELKVMIISCSVSHYVKGHYKLFRLFEPNLPKNLNVVRYSKALSFGSMNILSTPVSARNITGDDPAIYLHSSGTTGAPKTVILSNRALNELSQNIYDYVDPKLNLKPDDTMLMNLPLFHGFGLGVCVHLMMYFGCTHLQIMFKADQTVKIIRKYKGNHMMLCLVPNMLRRIISQPGFSGDHLKKVSAAFIGGDKLDETLLNKSYEILNKNGSNCLLCEGFGLSETSSVTNINIDKKPGGTVGRPICNVKEKIMVDGKEVPPNVEGDLYICTPSVMSGYYESEVDGGVLEKDEEGNIWIRTGDRALIDEEGFLYYKGRLKRMIIIGGVNIYPQEVEAIAITVPEVTNACAIRSKTNRNKPCLKLLVTLSEGVTLNNGIRQKIETAIREGILPYAVPKEIIQVEKLELNGIGKTNYRYYEELEDANNEQNKETKKEQKKEPKKEIKETKSQSDDTGNDGDKGEQDKEINKKPKKNTSNTQKQNNNVKNNSNCSKNKKNTNDVKKENIEDN